MQTARVIIAHQTKFADPIIVRAGEQVTLGKRDVNNPGWIWCTSRHGKSGWAPENWIRSSGDTGILLRDYSAAELDVNVGDELIVDFEESGWLWCTSPAGRTGWIPANCIEQTT